MSRAPRLRALADARRLLVVGALLVSGLLGTGLAAEVATGPAGAATASVTPAKLQAYWLVASDGG
ncbi:MAG TPA: hypothetical protein VHW47_08280, partial [Acidimicrobiales bacterium]|nr:hypothetical protein [Acidimicrobiales bacterium]